MVDTSLMYVGKGHLKDMCSVYSEKNCHEKNDIPTLLPCLFKNVIPTLLPCLLMDHGDFRSCSCARFQGDCYSEHQLVFKPMTIKILPC